MGDSTFRITLPLQLTQHRLWYSMVESPGGYLLITR
jgi:hypothetical protein